MRRSVPFSSIFLMRRRVPFRNILSDRFANAAFVIAVLLLTFPAAAHASPFDTGIQNVQTLFTGTVAKAASLIAVVLGGLGFAFGEPGGNKALASTAFGIGVALLAVQVISWIWSA